MGKLLDRIIYTCEIYLGRYRLIYIEELNIYIYIGYIYLGIYFLDEVVE
nr:MAG TPA: hypothetical protein [Caudoviricetes sp.]